MQLIRGLSLFAKTNSRGCYNIASWHSPHSMTWSWVLSLSLPRRGQGRFFHFATFRSTLPTQWHLQLMWFTLSWLRQNPMWYRDTYHKLNDEQAQRERRLWLCDDHPHKLHDLPPPIPAATVDGGLSRH